MSGGLTNNGVPYSDSDTSKDAADSIGDVTALRAAVLDFIKSRGKKGATCDEAEMALGLKHQTASARFWELNLKFKRIIKTDKKRPTRSGRSARVYITN